MYYALVPTCLSEKKNIDTNIGNIDEKLNKYKDETYTYVATTKENCYTYTKYWVDRIIGGAPDFLDSLDEIKIIRERFKDI